MPLYCKGEFPFVESYSPGNLRLRRGKRPVPCRVETERGATATERPANLQFPRRFSKIVPQNSEGTRTSVSPNSELDTHPYKGPKCKA